MQGFNGQLTGVKSCARARLKWRHLSMFTAIWFIDKSFVTDNDVSEFLNSLAGNLISPKSIHLVIKSDKSVQ